MAGGEYGVVKGPWGEDEDEMLLSYISKYGQGHWETLARKAGLNRTGKSCRLRWLNYLRPGVRRGNITLQEQLIILQLHSRWGNRWAKIAECLPGRSDNEIKNYWRTRVQKQAKQLQCDVNSYQFKEILHHVWMPQLAERAGQTQLESSPITMSEKLSSSESKSQSQTDANENDIDILNLDTTLHGVGVIGGSMHADLSCEKRIPWEDIEARKEEELTTDTWFDHDICSLENMWNDDEMWVRDLCIIDEC